MLNPYLFIYGTLMQAGNPFAHYLTGHSTFYSNGSFKGKLYDVGEYPGALFDERTESMVHGSIILLTEPESSLKIIDEYEGFGPDEPQPNLFIRKLMDVNAGQHTLQCWVYIYNHPVDGLQQITSGNYLLYKKSP